MRRRARLVNAQFAERKPVRRRVIAGKHLRPTPERDSFSALQFQASDRPTLAHDLLNVRNGAAVLAEVCDRALLNCLHL